MENIYRAWADGKMHYPTEGMWWYFSPNYWALSIGAELREIVCDSLNSVAAVLMQHIGREDKNEKGIYDDDIVKAHHPDHLDYFIGRVTFNTELLTYCLVGLKFDIPMNEFEDFEIIGNVYQNPELLEP